MFGYLIYSIFQHPLWGSKCDVLPSSDAVPHRCLALTVQICKHVVVKDSKTTVLDLRWRGSRRQRPHDAVNWTWPQAILFFVFLRRSPPVRFLSVYMKAFVFIYFQLKCCGFAPHPHPSPTQTHPECHGEVLILKALEMNSTTLGIVWTVY